jgi:uncharacterized protein
MTGESRYYAAFTSDWATAMKAAAAGPSLERFRAREFAAHGESISGAVSAGDWPRVREAVADPSSGIRYRVEGGSDGAGHPCLAIELEGEVALVCQRGLHPMPVSVNGRTLVLLAANERELEAWDRDNEDAEVVLAPGPIDLREVLEDELLLRLPFAPLCDDPGCLERAQAALRKAAADNGPAQPAANPFGALRGKLGAKQSN